MYATIADLYDIGTAILSFRFRKVSFGSQKVSFGSQKVTSGHLESSLWDDFGAWEDPWTGFAKLPHHFWVILEVILGAQSEPESYKFVLTFRMDFGALPRAFRSA